jgi:hypothetical protein
MMFNNVSVEILSKKMQNIKKSWREGRKRGERWKNSRIFATVRAYVGEILGRLVSSNDGSKTDILGSSKKSFPGGYKPPSKIWQGRKEATR